jgi:hypothetical protein
MNNVTAKCKVCDEHITLKGGRWRDNTILPREIGLVERMSEEEYQTACPQNRKLHKDRLWGIHIPDKSGLWQQFIEKVR